eukprot:Gb_05055 [translate_table: standard]
MSGAGPQSAKTQVLHGHNQHNSFYSNRLAHGHGHLRGHHAYLPQMRIEARTEVDARTQGEVHAHVGGDHSHLQLHYVQTHADVHQLDHNGEDGMLRQDPDEDAGGDEGMEDGDVQSDGGQVGEPHVSLAVRSQGTNQLTLSYQGEVYVFDTIPPEKVLNKWILK